jgi:hypothetical protein
MVRHLGDALGAAKSTSRHAATKTKRGTVMRASIAVLRSSAARSGSDVAAQSAARNGARLTAGGDIICRLTSHAQIRRAQTQERKGRTIAQCNAATVTCGCLSAFAKTQRAARKLKGQRRGHARQRWGKITENIAAANVPGITDGAQVGRARHGAGSTWRQHLPGLCKPRCGKNAKYLKFHSTSNARAGRCWIVTAGYVSCATLSAIANTSLTKRRESRTQRTQSMTISFRLQQKTAPVMSSLTRSACAVNATIRRGPPVTASFGLIWKDR